MLFWIEIRRSQGYWLLPLMIVLGIYTAIGDLVPDFVLWPSMSRAILESHIVVGALTAALGAWLIGRERRRRLDQLLASIPGAGFRRDVLAVAATAFWGLAGFAGIVIWFGGHAVLRATWGGPELDQIGLGITAVVMFAALGVLLGRVVPGRYGPLVAFAFVIGLTFVTQALTTERSDGTTGNPAKFLSPFGLIDGVYVGVFYRLRESLVTEVIVWTLALTVLLLAVMAMCRQRSLVTVVALASAVGLATVAATPLVGREDVWGPEVYAPVAYTPVCEVRDGFEVCVHPAYEGELDEVATSVAALFGPVHGLEGVPIRWEQSDSMMPFDEGSSSGGFSEPGNEIFMIEMVASLFPVEDGGLFAPRPASQLVIMDWLVTQSGLDLEPDLGMGHGFGWPAEALTDAGTSGGDMIEVDPVEPERAALVAAEAEIDAAVARFAALTPDEQQAWLEANWDALRAGEITLDEMP
jgi:hypothetical protein